MVYGFRKQTSRCSLGGQPPNPRGWASRKGWVAHSFLRSRTTIFASFSGKEGFHTTGWVEFWVAHSLLRSRTTLFASFSGKRRCWIGVYLRKLHILTLLSAVFHDIIFSSYFIMTSFFHHDDFIITSLLLILLLLLLLLLFHLYYKYYLYLYIHSLPLIFNLLHLFLNLPSSFSPQ
jgi:hypothetical protein